MASSKWHKTCRSILGSIFEEIWNLAEANSTTQKNWFQRVAQLDNLKKRATEIFLNKHREQDGMVIYIYCSSISCRGIKRENQQILPKLLDI